MQESNFEELIKRIQYAGRKERGREELILRKDKERSRLGRPSSNLTGGAIKDRMIMGTRDLD